MNPVLLKSFRRVASPLEKCLCVADPIPPIGQWAPTSGLWLADHSPSARPGHWCQVMAPRIISAQRRLGVKTGPDNQRIIKPQCDTNVRQQIAPRNGDTHILQTRVPTCTRGQGHTGVSLIFSHERKSQLDWDILSQVFRVLWRLCLCKSSLWMNFPSNQILETQFSPLQFNDFPNWTKIWLP